MNRETAAVFIGHRDCTGLDSAKVEQAVCRLVGCGVTDFLCGGMGDFDWMCARLTYEMKQKYPNIHCDLIIPYLTFRVLEPKYFDSIVYPEGFEKYHFKAAIVARNRYLADQSAYALCYVTHSWGGAAQTYRRAEKKKLQIKNLSDINLLKQKAAIQTSK